MKVSRVLLLSALPPNHIKNINVPVCRNCIHHIPNKSYDYITPFSKCSKFGEKDIISGDIINNRVERCRTNENMCGEEGKYFEEDLDVEKKIFDFNVRKTFKDNYVYLYFPVLFYIGFSMTSIIHKVFLHF